MLCFGDFPFQVTLIVLAKGAAGAADRKPQKAKTRQMTMRADVRILPPPRRNSGRRPAADVHGKERIEVGGIDEVAANPELDGFGFERCRSAPSK